MWALLVSSWLLELASSIQTRQKKNSVCVTISLKNRRVDVKHATKMTSTWTKVVT